MSSPADEIILIVRADDAASCRDANLAIRETVERGIVRNISIMGCAPALAHAAEVLAGLPGICFGLHATVNAEWESPRWRPVLDPSRVPSLVQSDGGFFPHPMDLNERGFSAGELGAEIRAQLRRVVEAGFPVRYLDTHMGFDWVPGARRVLEEIAESDGLVLDHPTSHPRLPATTPGQSLKDRILTAPPGRWVLVTHPGGAGGDMEEFRLPGDPPGLTARARDLERRELCSPAVKRAVRARGARLGTYAPPPHGMIAPARS